LPLLTGSALLLIQSVALLLESRCTERYSLGLQLNISSILSLISAAFEIFVIQAAHLENIQRSLVAAECCCHLAAAALCWLLPRRPNVYHDDSIVDRELSTSFLGRFTYTWANKIIRLSRQEEELDPAQLPGLDHSTRSQTLLGLFSEVQRRNDDQMPDGCTTTMPMWRILVQSNLVHIALSGALCLFLAVLSFAPHMALLHILQVLESDSPDRKSSLQLGAWGVSLGLAIICSSLVEQWVNWVSYNKISVRIIEQISITVFHKAMRLTGARGSEKSGDETVDGEGCSAAKSTINLVGVDGQRIGRFAT
jgi:hypothetical protein